MSGPVRPARPRQPTPAALSSTSYLAPVDINGPDFALPVTTPSAQPKAKPKAASAPVDNTLISAMTDSGIPAVALNAYRVAAARVDNDDPGCGIDWALLAGIGREESDHGQFAGAVLHADGVSTPRIIGIPLNGHGTALIPDTDHGRLDGDTVYDHAVGPMQFIPSTWAIYGADANGDGVADVFNINDAALAAARYLCDAGGNLRTHAGQVAAILSYNESDQYLAQVLALADAYRRGIPVTGIPVGNITGALAPVNSGGTPPPVNPGAPTANRPPARGEDHSQTVAHADEDVARWLRQPRRRLRHPLGRRLLRRLTVRAADRIQPRSVPEPVLDQHLRAARSVESGPLRHQEEVAPTRQIVRA